MCIRAFEESNVWNEVTIVGAFTLLLRQWIYHPD